MIDNFPNNKEEIHEITEEIKSLLNNWLNSSSLSEEKLKEYKTKEKVKLIEENRDNVVAIALTYEENGIRSIIGAPVVAADTTDLTPFYQDGFLLFTAIANILDKSNKEDPVNGSYTGNYFTRKVMNFYKKKLG